LVADPVTVLIPAFNEAVRIAATVGAARALPGVARVVVIDDGSQDDTAEIAEAVGAEVVRLPVNSGKGAALRAGLAACPGADDDIFLLLDADLGLTAAEAARLLAPVAANEADLAIACFPRPAGPAGFGLVKGLARRGTRWLTGLTLAAPISGQRACRRWVLAAAPIADGYGVEVAMNIAAGDAGARVVEVPAAMSHAATGRDWAGFRHRGKQFLHIFEALLAAACGRTGEPLWQWPAPGRFLLWGVALVAVHFLFWLRVQPALTALQLDAVPWLVIMALLGPAAVVLGTLLLRMRKRNYAGRTVLAIGGLALLPLLVAVAGMRAEAPLAAVAWLPTMPVTQYIALALLGWLLLGLFDDRFGAADRRGFRGHVGALARGRLTTGGVKLLGGGLLALGMAWLLWRVSPGMPSWTIALSTLLIALSANMLNLFDLRPGRALKIYWAFALPLLVVLTHYAAATFALRAPLALLASILLLATLVYAPFDFAAMMMLGDTGANVLGAFLGLCLAVVLPVWGQGVAVVLLVLFHIYTERVSLTRVIARVPVLAWLDRLGRVPETT
jgi:hypothetical protein